MEKNLPARPNLDHLRRQAKSLLSALEARDNEAASTIQVHLPSAQKMTTQQVLATRWRLAGLRSAVDNEVKISFAGQTMIRVLVRLDETQDPMHIDCYNLAGASKGTTQHGIFKWIGEEACFCMSAPSQPRPMIVRANPPADAP
ncbi:MAG TPA: hypothetical protein VL282_03545 [Tepidisphaeraceae bacterium]|nr:hypothetical protein [Tepidisphaeraceae bacterium]